MLLLFSPSDKSHELFLKSLPTVTKIILLVFFLALVSLQAFKPTRAQVLRHTLRIIARGSCHAVAAFDFSSFA